MRRLILAILILLSGCQTLIHAQGNVTKQINEIKRNADYIYAESTDENWNTALENAKILLAEQVEHWIATESDYKDVEGCLAKASEHVLEMKATRGQFFRAFVYVKKSDVVPYSNADKVMMIPVNKSASQKVESSSPPSQPVVAEKESEPVVEVKSEPVFEVESEPVHTSVPMIPELDDSSSFENSEATASTPLTMREKELIVIDRFAMIEGYVKEKRASGALVGYGKYETMPRDKECYLLVYDRSGIIAAHLHCNGKVCTNLITGEADQISNYKGCGAFWLQFK